MKCGRTRSGQVYNIDRVDALGESGEWSMKNPQKGDIVDKKLCTMEDKAGLYMWEQMGGGMMLWTGETIGDTYSEAKALRYVAREWHTSLTSGSVLKHTLQTWCEMINRNVENGDAFFYKCREEFVDRYTMNICDIILGSLESNDWSWTDEEEWTYW